MRKRVRDEMHATPPAEIPGQMPQCWRHWLSRKSDIKPSLGFFPVKISPDGENAQPCMRFG